MPESAQVIAAGCAGAYPGQFLVTFPRQRNVIAAPFTEAQFIQIGRLARRHLQTPIRHVLGLADWRPRASRDRKDAAPVTGSTQAETLAPFDNVGKMPMRYCAPEETGNGEFRDRNSQLTDGALTLTKDNIHEFRY